MDLSRYQTTWLELSRVNFENKMFMFRVHIGDGDVSDLVASFKERGQQDPIVVWQRTTGELVVVCGYRRFTAARICGFEKIYATIVLESDMNYDQAFQLSIDENVLRKSYTELDMMSLCIRMKNENKTISDIARQTTKSRSMVRQYLYVSNMAEGIQMGIRDGKISIKNAISLVTEPAQGQEGVPSEALAKEGVVPGTRGVADDSESINISIEKSNRLVEALNSSDYRNEIKKLLNQGSSLAMDFASIPEFEQGFKKALKGRNNFDAQPSSAEPNNSMYVKLLSNGAELKLAIDVKSDTLATLQMKAEFLKSNAAAITKISKMLEKEYIALRKKAAKPAKPIKTKWNKVANEVSKNDMQEVIKSVEAIQPGAADVFNAMMPVGLVLSADPNQSNGDSLREVKLNPGESIKVYARYLLGSGQWFPVTDATENIKWQAAEGIEITPNTGPEVEIKLHTQLTEPKEIRVLATLSSASETSAVLVIK